jgi:hypothetical protein
MGQRSIIVTALLGLVLLMILLTVGCGGLPTAAKDPALPAATQSPVAGAQAPASPGVTPVASQGTAATATPDGNTGRLEPAADQETAAPAMPQGTSAPIGSEAEAIVRLAVTDLAERLGVPEEDIAVVVIEAVEWPDASLGCALPGMAYTQVVTPGYRVVLQVEDRLYDYRTDSEQRVVFCGEEEMTDLLDDASPAEADQARAVRVASEDLARRLSIAMDQIRLLEVREVTWPDSSLGCAQPGETYQQVPQDGLLIRLGAGGRMYFYHSGASGEPFLCEGTAQMIPQVIPKDDELVPPPDWEID